MDERDYGAMGAQVNHPSARTFLSGLLALGTSSLWRCEVRLWWWIQGLTSKLPLLSKLLSLCSKTCQENLRWQSQIIGISAIMYGWEGRDVNCDDDEHEWGINHTANAEEWSFLVEWLWLFDKSSHLLSIATVGKCEDKKMVTSEWADQVSTSHWSTFPPTIPPAHPTLPPMIPIWDDLRWQW